MLQVALYHRLPFLDLSKHSYGFHQNRYCFPLFAFSFALLNVNLFLEGVEL